MIKALLFDLDDTLIDNDVTVFRVPYFKLLHHYLANHFPLNGIIPTLIHSSDIMLANTNPTRTLKHTFDDHFYPAIQLSANDMAPVFEQFYVEQFPSLQSLTSPRPAARQIIQWAFGQGYQVVIATDPVLPQIAAETRLRWGGVGVNEFDYAFITAYETFHFSKSNPEYYAEILTRLECHPEEALMIGNDWERDIVPAAQVGLNTYWITNGKQSPPIRDVNIAGWGTLADFLHWANDHNCIETLTPQPLQPISYLARLNAVPATLLHLTEGLTESQWYTRPEPGEWSPSEIIQHLIDAELAALQSRLDLILNKEFVFLPKVDLTRMAAERPADAPSGPDALAALIDARQATYNRLQSLAVEDWERTARHAIFGPTTLTELVAFTLDHDWKHLRQLRETVAIVTGS